MDKNFGYTGQILRVNLSTHRIGIEPTDPYVLQALGGRGLGQAILFDELDPSVDPLGPDNKIILSAGPLVGTLAPGASRLSVDFKNVQTAGVGSANVGGHLARDDWDRALGAYYAQQGWDSSTGQQTETILRELGLKEVEAKLKKYGKL